MLEFKVTYESFSNVMFQGHSDWEVWDGTEEELSDFLLKGHNTSQGLDIALEASGFCWDFETREYDESNE